MKKFIGNVNGVEYNDRNAFNEAVKKAMEDNSDNMCISSYYKETCDDCDDCKKEDKQIEDKKENVIVTLDDLALTRDSKKRNSFDRVEFDIPSDLVKKLSKCENKDDVEKYINDKRHNWCVTKSRDLDELGMLKKQLCETEKKIEDMEDDIEVVKGGIRYYDNLLYILNHRDEESLVDYDIVDRLSDFGRILRRILN